MAAKSSANPAPALRLTVRVTPNAKQSALVGWKDDILHIRLAAKPADGAANAELVKCLAKTLEIAPSAITLTSGHTSRLKRLDITGVSAETLRQKTKPR